MEFEASRHGLSVARKRRDKCGHLFLEVPQANAAGGLRARPLASAASTAYSADFDETERLDFSDTAPRGSGVGGGVGGGEGGRLVLGDNDPQRVHPVCAVPPDLLPLLHVEEGALPAAIVEHRQRRAEALRVELALLEVDVDLDAAAEGFALVFGDGESAVSLVERDRDAICPGQRSWRTECDALIRRILGKCRTPPSMLRDVLGPSRSAASAI